MLAPLLFLGWLVLRFLDTLSSAFNALRERSIEVVMEGEGGPWLLVLMVKVLTEGAVALLAVLAIRWAIAHRRIAIAAISGALGANLLAAALQLGLAKAFPSDRVAPPWPLALSAVVAGAWFIGLRLSSRPATTFTL